MKLIQEKVVLITGSTDGIGKATAIALATQNVNVLIHGRNKNKVERTAKELTDLSHNSKIEGFVADFSSLEEVRNLAFSILKNHGTLDVLINNAGAGPSDDRYGKDGTELRFTVNYLAPFLLTYLLLPALRAAKSPRVVNVGSVGQMPINFNDIMLEENFNGMTAYCQSKLALVMFTMDLAYQLRHRNITVNCLHPGDYLNTNMVRKTGVTPLAEPEIGADAELYLSLSPMLDGITGRYFNLKQEGNPHSQAFDWRARQRLREISLNLTGLTGVVEITE